jgi:hypothetical protein
MLCGYSKHLALIQELIGPALIPAAALTAVPESPPPAQPTGNPLPLATLVFNSSFPVNQRRKRGSRNMPGEAAGPSIDDGAFSDPESSLYDYQLMEEAGYN